MLKKGFFTLFTSCLALVFVLPLAPLIGGANQIQKGEMAGYLLVPNERVPETYNAGFSMYVAAWPLLKEYPGNRFQTGLFGTWMHAKYESKPAERLYSDIEGGLGWGATRDSQRKRPSSSWEASPSISWHGRTGPAPEKEGTGINRRASTAWRN